MALTILEYSHQSSQWKKSFSMHFYKHASMKEEKPSFMLEEGQEVEALQNVNSFLEQGL